MEVLGLFLAGSAVLAVTGLVVAAVVLEERELKPMAQCDTCGAPAFWTDESIRVWLQEAHWSRCRGTYQILPPEPRRRWWQCLRIGR